MYYNRGMGLIGLIITIALMVLGAGYYFYAAPSTRMTLMNDDAAAPQGLGLYEHLKTEATDIKNSEEERVEAEIAMLEESLGEELVITKPPEETVDSAPDITNRLMSTGFAVPKKARSIDTIVLHSSYNPNGGDAYSAEKIVQIYESYEVGAHYLIDRSGKVYRLVEDGNIAYHAGASKMPDGRKDVNDFSIGIEMMNKEDTEFTKDQYEAVNELIAYLKKKHGIKNIVGHGDIAPTRKTDPWNFDWKKLK